MRVTSFWGASFKGLDLDLPWAPVTVLFGPNDVGKSNVLELLEFAFADKPWEPRSDAFLGMDEPMVLVEIELSERDLRDHPDAYALASLLQYGGSWLFWTDSVAKYQLGEEAPPVQVPWELREGLAIEFSANWLTLDEVVAELREHYLAMAFDADPTLPRTPYEVLVDAVLASPWFQCERDVTMRVWTIRWMAPGADDATADVLGAARDLAGYGLPASVPLANVAKRRVPDEILVLAGDAR